MRGETVHSVSIEPNTDLLALLPPEARLLFLCAVGESAATEIGTLCRGDLDWEVVCRLVQREGAAPTVWKSVERFGGLSPSAPPLGALRRIARVTAFKMNYLHQRLGETVGALDQARIDSVLLKGAALATSVYGSAEERPMVDIDLLVSRGAAREALATLLATGWAWQAGKDTDWRLDASHHLPALIDARGMEISLELHTALFPPGSPFHFPPEMMQHAATPAVVGAARIPHPTHMLLHTCTHFAWSHLLRKHAWRAFRDVAAIIEKHSMDWGEFVSESKKARAQTCCYWTFRLARGLVGVAIPDDVLAALRPPIPSPILDGLERHFAVILMPSTVDCPSVRLRRLMWSAGVLPSWSGHGISRPWIVLKLSPEGMIARGILSGSAGGQSARSAGRAWAGYWRSVVLGASRQRAVLSS